MMPSAIWSVLEDAMVRAAQMFLTVYLSNNDKHFTEVPVTPETLCRDVVDLCKEPGEVDCYLAETWRGSERVIGDSERMIEVLQRWGQQRAEVRFFIRHDQEPSHETGGPRDLLVNRNTVKVSAERHLENGMVLPRMDITLTELQEMASRQQQQINAQQQLLASKEQRLRFLQQQDERQRQRQACEQERLRALRDNAEAQEAKLRRVRALKGQVEQKRLGNSKLVEEIEQMNGLFQQKQRELLGAVSRVEELSRQLELLRGAARLDNDASHSSAGELEHLYKELQLRNKLNEEQSVRLQQQRENLGQRTQEVASMERRVAELRERLCRKKAALQQKENLPQPAEGQGSHPPIIPARVAAVGPYIQTAPPLPPRQEVVVKPAYPDGTATLPKPLAKPSGLGLQAGKISKTSDWCPGVEVSTVGGSQHGHSSTLPRMSTHGSTEKDPQADSMQPPLPLRKNQSSDDLLRDGQCAGKVPPPVPSKPKPVMASQSGYGKPSFSTGTFPGKARPAPQLPPPPARSQRPPMPAPHHGNAPKADTLPAATVRPFSVESGTGKGAATPPTLHKPQTLAASSIYSMYTQHSSLAKGYQGQSTLTRSQPRLYGKPVIPSTAGHHSHSQDGSQTEADQVDQGAAVAPTSGSRGEGPEAERTPRPLSPTKLLPFLSHMHRLQSDAELEALRKRLHHAPRPLKKRSSITEPEGPAGPNIQKLLYQKTTLAAMETGEEAEGRARGGAPNDLPIGRDCGGEEEEEEEEHTPPPLRPRRPAPDDSGRQRVEEREKEATDPPPPESYVDEYPPYPPPPYPTTADQDGLGEEGSTMKAPEITGQVTLPPGKRTNLRKAGSERIKHGMRVRFNPLALLLDSSLEGEYDLVQRIIYEVEDPSMPNDEGITALHNAVCAGHTEIVKFLVQFGVNVNAADSDGWTPLHCAASCNSVQVCKFLVECGAAVFATTHSDMQTAADKCEELEEGYAQCSQFLYGVQEKMGVMNRGVVYALWDYEAESADELSFREGDCMTVLRREDGEETEWWWARCGDNEGYIPRNLLGLYLRIKPRQRSLA
ncbi:apoptosis-stimulating of p53 protein 2b isoform X2 [Electrophorus electricus]|uniref:apoptosis-stimulating of p53 protein 2b isoform X2 n=1 Tax=Electrophorus electricus TaxID=8005 RepID=UPI0015D039B2|nr:apoptosis-stimulating of p53 protein 2b isoform X2 [Electrophorus electricus]